MRIVRLALALIVGTMTSSPPSHAGAVDRTCFLDRADLGEGWRALANPHTCPPGDLTVQNAQRSFVLGGALWSRWLGRGRLPAVVEGSLVWIQADGDRSLLRVTDLVTGATVTLGRGGFLPDAARSGHLPRRRRVSRPDST